MARDATLGYGPPMWPSLWLAAALAGAAPVEDAPLVTVTLHAAAPAHKGDAHVLAARFTVAPGWHIYWRNPGDSGLKTDVQWKLPRGFTAGAPLYGVPTRFSGTGGSENYGYEGEAWLFTSVKGPARGHGKVTARTRWLACTPEECVPGESEQTVMWPASDDAVRTRMAALVPRAVPSEVTAVKDDADRAVWVVHLDAPVPPASSVGFIPDLPAGFRVVAVAADGATVRVTLETRASKVRQRLQGVVVHADTHAPRAWAVDAPFP